jgi:2-polyprenyl-6-methoxyphenol hydroxylase-like FAD-dependent oxidoreductase
MSDTPTVCIAGGGPAGMVLAYLLARQNIPVTVLELHGDFERAFRGDTFHSTSLELMDDLGLGQRMKTLVHSRLPALSFITKDEKLDFIRFDLAGGKYPYLGLVPQARFLDLLAEEGKKLPCFDLRMHSSVKDLIEEDGRVSGVIYESSGSAKELRTRLVVGADGRGSTIRTRAGIELMKSAPPMDILWFELPAGPGDDEIDPLAIRFGSGTMLIMVNRGDHWQAGYIIVKGGVKAVHDEGIEALRQTLRAMVPPLGDRVNVLQSWKETQLLAVTVGRVAKWYKPGLLLIGDAAHVMSPVGGVGINYAVQDAVAAANILTRPLKSGTLTTDHLDAVQARREWPTRMMQRVQTAIQQRVIAQALRTNGSFSLPLPMKMIRHVPLLRRLPGRIIGRGFRVEHLRHQ